MKKVLFFLFATVILFVAFFPYRDLGDLVSIQVSKATQNKVFLSFEDVGFNLLPQPSVALQKVYMESAFAPNLTVGSLAISPSIRGLLTLKPGVALFFEDFMSGNLSVNTRGGEKTKKGNRKQVLQINIDKMNLKQIIALLKSPVAPKGSIEGDADVTFDPSFLEQPDGKINLTINRFHLTPATIPTMMGPFSLPDLKLSNITLQGRLAANQLFIDSIKIGNSKDELNGVINGKMQLTLRKSGDLVIPQFGRYNLTIDLKTLPSLEKKLGPYLGLLESYKVPSIGSSRYAVKLSGANFYGVPKIEKIQK